MPVADPETEQIKQRLRQRLAAKSSASSDPETEAIKQRLRQRLAAKTTTQTPTDTPSAQASRASIAAQEKPQSPLGAFFSGFVEDTREEIPKALKSTGELALGAVPVVGPIYSQGRAGQEMLRRQGIPDPSWAEGSIAQNEAHPVLGPIQGGLESVSTVGSMGAGAKMAKAGFSLGKEISADLAMNLADAAVNGTLQTYLEHPDPKIRDYAKNWAIRAGVSTVGSTIGSVAARAGAPKVAPETAGISAEVPPDAVDALNAALRREAGQNPDWDELTQQRLAQWDQQAEARALAEEGVEPEPIIPPTKGGDALEEKRQEVLSGPPQPETRTTEPPVPRDVEPSTPGPAALPPDSGTAWRKFLKGHPPPQGMRPEDEVNFYYGLERQFEAEWAKRETAPTDTTLRVPSRTTKEEPELTPLNPDVPPTARPKRFIDETATKTRIAERVARRKKGPQSLGSTGGEQLSMLIEDLVDYAIIGAHHVKRGARKFADFSAKMVSDGYALDKRQMHRVFMESRMFAKKLGADDAEFRPEHRLALALKFAKDARRDTEAMRSTYRSKQAGRVMGEFSASRGEESLNRGLGELAGIQPRSGDFGPTRELFTQEEFDSMLERIKERPDFAPQRRVGLMNAFRQMLTDGRIPQPNELAAFDRIFGPDVGNAIRQARDGGTLGIVKDIWNFPKQLRSTFDVSTTLRQSLVATMAHPKRALGRGGNFYKQVGAMVNPKYAQKLMDDLQNRSTQAMRDEYGVHLLPLESKSNVATGEEAFSGGLLERIENAFGRRGMDKSAKVTRVLGIPLRASERAAAVYGNLMRADIFDDQMAKWKRRGVSVNEKDIEWLVKHVNNATGRGGLSRAEALSGEMATVFWSPRTFTSRAFFLNPVMYAKAPPKVRKIMARDFAITVGQVSTAVGLMSLVPGVEVETDLASSDFMKIKIGNKRIDPWGGFQQIVRAAYQIAMNKRKNLRTGKTEQPGRWHLTGRFLRSKLAPSSAAAVDVLTKKEYTGAPTTPRGVARNLSVPLVVDDVARALLEEWQRDDVDMLDAASGATDFGLGAIGLGVQNFDDKDQSAPLKRPPPLKAAPLLKRAPPLTRPAAP